MLCCVLQAIRRCCRPSDGVVMLQVAADGRGAGEVRPESGAEYAAG